ncbi:putative secreted protein (Por secretion system target) [Spirosoma oryzae]|uniref:Putative secreted protein (Por secretion system target) n=1 Tax=Spirosoma oryzae TaxID=1469603 RepID=A0A2T0S8N0_9BACT|nr:T9SS type A sorting domain-containing protein [Spirosoma oryzae]PRY29741.1 putative secreted protein (Por secretion system target) [Spirosoma oryzae]
MKKVFLGRLVLGLAIANTYFTAQAQVKFKLTRADEETYIVSMVPQQTVADRGSITGTMQVSMKIRAAEGFELGAITSLQPDVAWDKGTLIKSPDGARDYDYLSVALQTMATRGLAYEKGKEVPLFSFRNVGQPISSIQLLDNSTDPLLKAATNRFNVQNHISVLGYGQKNAYVGNLADENPGSQKVGLRQIYPNPAKDRATVTWVNYLDGFEGQVTLLIADATGKVVSQETAYMRSGSSAKEITVEQLPVGHYMVYLERGGVRLGVGQKMLIAR